MTSHAAGAVIHPSHPPLRHKTQRYIAQGDNMRVRSPHFPRNAPHTVARIAAVLITLSLYTACAADKSGPTELNTIPRSEKQPRIPLTVRLDASGGIRGDTTRRIGARAIRVIIERVDTLSVRRPF